MAATNFTPIQLYFSTTASAVPTAANLAQGELAINITDGKLYYENNSGVVTLLASATTVTNSFSAGTTGLTPNTATTGAVTLAGTLAVANGGTGLTAGTSGGVLAYTASGTLASSTALAASALVIGGGAGAAPSTTTTGTGVVTALGVNVGSAGAFVVNGGALGTPSSGTATNLTGLPLTTGVTGTLPTANGGTNLGGATPFTSTGVLYASSTSALATGSALTFDGANLGVSAATATISITSTTGTNAVYESFVNTGGTYYSGIDNSTGATFTGTAYSVFRYAPIGRVIKDIIAGTGAITTISSTGLAVTGTLSATGTLSGGTSGTGYSFSGSAPATSLTLASSGQIQGVLNNASVGNATSMQLTQNGAGDAAISFLIGATTEWLAGVDNSDSDSFKINAITGGSDFNGTGITLTTGGNLGLGVTPSAWGGAFKVLQLANGTSLSNNGQTSYYQLGANNYFDGSDYKYIASNYAGFHRFSNAGAYEWHIAASGTAGNAITFTQAMTLDASGNLVVGNSTASQKFQVERNWDGSTWGYFVNTDSGSGAAAGILMKNNTGDLGAISLLSSANSPANALFIRSLSTNPLVFGTNNTERARIDSSGNLLVGTTSSAGTLTNTTTDDGFGVDPLGYLALARSGGSLLYCNRLTDDGFLVEFIQAGTKEGDISVSGTTVSYNGGHLSRYAQTTASKDDTLVKGTVMSNLDEMNVYTKDGQPVDNEQLNKVKVSDVEGDANVAGVFVNWTHDEAHDVDEINMAMTGDMIIRIAQGVTVARGDLLMSAGDGTAKPQGDDIVRSKTVAKVTSTHVTCTYADGSFCVPCVLMAC